MAERFEMSKAYQVALDKLTFSGKISPRIAAIPAEWAYKGARCLSRLKAERLTRRTANAAEPQRSEAVLEKVYPRPKSSYGETCAFLPQSDLQLSVVVPCYNAEKTVKDTILSIVNQETTYPFEVLAVDDGSKDGTPGILQALSGAHPRLKVIPKANGGAGSARNAGLNGASGAYIMFCDADDVLLPGAVEALLNTAKQNNADVVQGSWKYLNGTTFRYRNGVCPSENICEISGVPWGKVYRRTLFRNVRFCENYNCFEDSIIKCLALSQAKHVHLTDAVVYAWRRDSNGITNTSKNANRSMQAYWVLKEMLEQYERLSFQKTKCAWLIFLQQFSSMIQRTAFFDDEIKHAIFQCARVLKLPEYGDYKELPTTQRLMYRALTSGNEALFYFVGEHWSYLI